MELRSNRFLLIGSPLLNILAVALKRPKLMLELLFLMRCAMRDDLFKTVGGNLQSLLRLSQAFAGRKIPKVFQQLRSHLHDSGWAEKKPQDNRRPGQIAEPFVDDLESICRSRKPESGEFGLDRPFENMTQVHDGTEDPTTCTRRTLVEHSQQEVDWHENSDHGFQLGIKLSLKEEGLDRRDLFPVISAQIGEKIDPLSLALGSAICICDGGTG